MTDQLAQNNRRVAVIMTVVVAAMVGLAFAAVPLYEAFCRVTGYGGTPKVADSSTGQVLEQTIRVRFNADTHTGMAWDFAPKQRFQTLKIGEQALAYYKAHNPAGHAITGQASFNVTPLKAGQYFTKVECFCFTKQKLLPDEAVDMPVLYFIDPAFASDPEMADVREITLSYTFYTLEEEVADNQPAVHENQAIEARTGR